MNVKRIDQLVAGFAQGDAISREARLFKKCFNQIGLESEIFCPAERIGPDVKEYCKTIQEFCAISPGSENAVILHYSTKSPTLDLYNAAKGPRIVRYHNITPSDFFRGYDDILAVEMAEGRAELASVAGAASAVWADSSFNADELHGMGCRSVNVVPLLFSLDSSSTEK